MELLRERCVTQSSTLRRWGSRVARLAASALAFAWPTFPQERTESPQDHLAAQQFPMWQAEIPGRVYAGRPRLASGAFLSTPPDGYCLYHSAVAARDTERWAAMPRDDMGFFRQREHEAAMGEEARVLRAQLMSLLEQAGRAADAARLRRAGVKGYVTENELPLFAQLIGGSVEIIPLAADGGQRRVSGAFDDVSSPVH